jgi:tetratricopeptide (TPR) repeat protein
VIRGGIAQGSEEICKMRKKFCALFLGGLLVMLSGVGFPVGDKAFAQAQDGVATVVEEFLQAVMKGDSAKAFDLCSSGLKRGKKADTFLESPEITDTFSGLKSWEILKVGGKGSIQKVVLNLKGMQGGQEMLSPLLVECLKMRDSYRLRSLSPTPWVSSEAQSFKALSDLYERMGDPDAALEAIEKAYSLAPDDPKISAFLGYVYIEKEVKADEAKKLIEAALEKEPKNPEFMDFMGWYYHKENKREESVFWFDMAREAFKTKEGYQSSEEYIRFTNHSTKAKATGWRPTQT